MALPDYSAIQSGWIRAYQAAPTAQTVATMVKTTRQAAEKARKTLDAQRPTFKFANAQLYRDADNFAARTEYYRDTLDADPESFPAVAHALLYGRDGLADVEPQPEGFADALKTLRLAPARGDMSYSVGLNWQVEQATDAWIASVWDSWLLALYVGPAAEILTAADIDVDTEQILRDWTGKSRAERQREFFTGLGVAVGIAASAAGLYFGFRQWRREK